METNQKVIYKKLKYGASTDYIGAASSFLCMVHCLITPLLFAVQATSLSCSAISPMWWKLVDVGFLVVSFFAIRHTSKTTSLLIMPSLLFITWSSLALLIVNNLTHLLYIPHFLIYVPALTLIVLHLYNKKYCQCIEENCCIE